MGFRAAADSLTGNLDVILEKSHRSILEVRYKMGNNSEHTSARLHSAEDPKASERDPPPHLNR
jgi:hypothetical protein